MKKIFFLLLLGLLLPAFSLADTAPIDIQLSPKQGTTSDQFLLTIRFRNTDINTLVKPQIPDNEQFAIRLSNQAFETNIMNGVVESAAVLSYSIYPSQSLAPGVYSIPDFEIEVGGKRYPVVGPKITIVASTANDSKLGDSDVSFRQVVDTTRPYVGQQVTYLAKLLTSGKFVRGDLAEFDIPSVIREDLGKQKQRTKQVGDRYLSIIAEAIIPTKVGTLEIPARTLTATLRQVSGRRSRSNSLFDFDPFDPLDRPFASRSYQKRYTSNAVSLEVRPLPPAPSDVSGYVPVGTLKARTTVKERNVAVGESTTVTIELYGNANLRPFELPKPINALNGVKLYYDQPSITTSVVGDKVMYRKRFSIAVVPTKPGTIEVPQFTITHFDPLRSRYIRTTTDAVTLKVEGDALVDSAPEQTPTQREEEVLGDGLYPQHEGPELYASKKSLSSGTIVAWILLLPFLAVLARVGTALLRAKNDPERKRRDGALRKATATLQQENVTVDLAWGAVMAFLRERGVLTQESVSSESIQRELLENTVSQETSLALSKRIAQLEEYRFSGRAQNPLSPDVTQALASEIESVDREAR